MGQGNRCRGKSLPRIKPFLARRLRSVPVKIKSTRDKM